MSSNPSGWTTPKKNWSSADIVSSTDLNRVEGNIDALDNGARTLDPAQAPTGNSGSLRQILSWLANRIRAITGMANWWDAPPTTLQAVKTHMDAAAAEAVAAVKAADGAGSGFDADLLDGKHGSEYANASHSHGASDLPSASTSAKGIVQLSTSTSSTSTSLAATPSAVKAAYDLANGKADSIATVNNKKAGYAVYAP